MSFGPKGRRYNNKYYGWVKKLKSEIGISEEHKRKISEANSGRKFTDSHKLKLSKSQLGRKHKNSTKKRMSERNRERLDKGTHHCLNVSPWENNKGKKCIHIWSEADYIYNIWVLEGRPGYINLSKKCGFPPKTTLRNMVRKFKENWIPIEDVKWLGTFKNG